MKSPLVSLALVAIVVVSSAASSSEDEAAAITRLEQQVKDLATLTRFLQP